MINGNGANLFPEYKHIVLNKHTEKYQKHNRLLLLTIHSIRKFTVCCHGRQRLCVVAAVQCYKAMAMISSERITSTFKTSYVYLYMIDYEIIHL